MTNKKLIEAARRASNKKRGVDLLNYRGGLLTKLAAALEAQEWQPIETAPRDGTVVFVWHVTKVIPYASFDNAIKKGRFLPEIGEWQVENVGGSVPPVVTHWKPLPLPPEAE